MILDFGQICPVGDDPRNFDFYALWWGKSFKTPPFGALTLLWGKDGSLPTLPEIQYEKRLGLFEWSIYLPRSSWVRKRWSAGESHRLMAPRSMGLSLLCKCY